MDRQKFDPSHSVDLLKHIDKWKEALLDTYVSIRRDLQKLQVEEEMLMRKMYEVVHVKEVATGAEPSNTGVNDEATKGKGP